MKLEQKQYQNNAIIMVLHNFFCSQEFTTKNYDGYPYTPRQITHLQGAVRIISTHDNIAE